MAAEARPVKPESRRSRRRRHKKNVRSKDPEVAAAYLEAWAEAKLQRLPKNRKRKEPSGGGGSVQEWKFNKATQAWLIRHAYDPARVPKVTFQLLLRYLKGLQGVARERASVEADTIVALGGAKLAAEAEEDAEEAPGASAPTEMSEETEGKVRKLRLRRAERVLAALADTG